MVVKTVLPPIVAALVIRLYTFHHYYCSHQQNQYSLVMSVVEAVAVKQIQKENKMVGLHALGLNL